MINNSTLKSLAAAALFGSLGDFAAAERNTEGNSARAPEATAANTEVPFREIPLLEDAFIDATPAEREDGLVVGELGVDGGNKAMIVELAQEIANGDHGNYDSLLIAHEGKLLFESYYLRGRINLAHPQASATKGHTSLALGRAIQLGHLTMADLDKPLIDFLDDLDRTKLVDGAERITLHKALTMHGGLSVSDEEWEALQQTPDAIEGQHFVQALLEESGPITAESQIYRYGNFNPMLVMAVIDSVVPGTAQNFIKTEILDKLAITNYHWQDHISGLPEAGWRVSMTSRDMLKLGDLVLNGGEWEGEQLIPEDYLAKATSGIVEPTEDWMPDSYRYGYFWYQTPLTVGDHSYNAAFAWGGGGQRIIIVEDLDLTIVITGHDGEDNTIMAQLAEHVLTAFVE
ncbi:MAG: serine hydrolase [Pseudomonadota bacterium]